ncbi:hypothetical protein WJX73_008419 [Symbiochloris irregularis]|uniref:Uncharacterized protein n=1 Tax=Symbiochloris irregularis TaxID=706552 RepID=A0AAW1PB19_9CHLO
MAHSTKARTSASRGPAASPATDNRPAPASGFAVCSKGVKAESELTLHRLGTQSVDQLPGSCVDISSYPAHEGSLHAAMSYLARLEVPLAALQPALAAAWKNVVHWARAAGKSHPCLSCDLLISAQAPSVPQVADSTVL